jgi:oligopeptide transport system permease protein
MSRPESPWRNARDRLVRNKLAVFGLVVLAVMLLGCVCAPILTPYGYEDQDLELGATVQSGAHWMGTDYSGRDVATRVLYGGRISFAVAFCATAVSLLIGVTWGAIAGYFGGRLDSLMMRVVDVMYALPYVLFVILIVTLFGSNFILLFLAIGAVEWLSMARIVRGQVLTIKRQDFVEACHALGVPRRRIIFKHILPNVLGPIIVYMTLTIPTVMLLEAFLSFLGLGIPDPDATWGKLINYGAKHMEEFPTLLIFPGIALSLTLFALNFVGDGLRDALDPRSAKDL